MKNMNLLRGMTGKKNTNNILRTKKKVEKNRSEKEKLIIMTDKGNFKSPSRIFSRNSNYLAFTMLLREVPNLTREVSENFVILNGTVNDSIDSSKYKEILIFLDPCSNINFILPKLVQELIINVKKKFILVEVKVKKPTPHTITNQIYVNIPFVVKGSNNKKAQSLAFTTRFNILDHFENTIHLRQISKKSIKFTAITIIRENRPQK